MQNKKAKILGEMEIKKGKIMQQYGGKIRRNELIISKYRCIAEKTFFGRGGDTKI
jgi:hypothetical protein